eukprot:15465207-Alexandrium_andersonii.AAC.1
MQFHITLPSTSTLPTTISTLLGTPPLSPRFRRFATCYAPAALPSRFAAGCQALRVNRLPQPSTASPVRPSLSSRWIP